MNFNVKIMINFTFVHNKKWKFNEKKWNSMRKSGIFIKIFEIYWKLSKNLEKNWKFYKFFRKFPNFLLSLYEIMMNFMKISFSFTRKSGISFKKSKLYEKKWNFPWNTQNNLKIWKNIHFFYSKKFWKVFTFSIKNYNLFDYKFTFCHKKKWNSNKKVKIIWEKVEIYT